MLDGRIFEDGQSERDSDPIVRAEGGTVRRNPVSVDEGRDRVIQEIMVAVARLLRDHIHMSLEDDTLAVLESRGGRLADDDVAGFVLDGLEAMADAPIIEVFDYLSFVLRGSRDLGKAVEVIPNDLGL